MSSEWQLNRIGLLDFWYYDEQEFEFVDGRMLLRGANGSGKSVTMQSFIPLLLDGNMRPERLDPFGSRARKMENYLLEEGDDREERTGYLYMELKRNNSDTYTTIGIGIRARKNKKLDTWYFCVTDGRRVGKDLFLYKDLQNRITCTKQELKNRLGEGGRVMETQGEYAQCVNRLLFGFETMEEYLEMLELLIQLRTPKLSKDFKPSVINEILSRSLQTLSEDDLRPMSEAIENMDNQKTNLDTLDESVRAAEQIEKIFDQYNEAVLYDKAKAFKECVQNCRKQEKYIEELQKKKEESERLYGEEQRHYEELENEEAVLKKETDSLKESDAAKLKERELQLRSEKQNTEEEVAAKKRQETEKEEKYRETERKRRNQQEENERNWDEIEEKLVQMEEVMEGIPFDEFAFLKKELQEEPEKEQEFQSHVQLLKEYTKRVEQGRDVLSEEKNCLERYDQKQQEIDERRTEQEQKEKECRQYETLLQEARDEFTEKFYLWDKQNSQLHPEDDTKQNIVQRIEKYSYGTDFNEIRDLCKPAYHLAERQLDDKLREWERRKEQLEEEEAQLQAELQEWKEKKDPEPECSEAVKKNRRLLQERGIPYLQFYKVVDFTEHIEEKQASCLEEAFLSMGILDALIVPAEYREAVQNLDKGVCDRYIFGDVTRIKKNLLEWMDVDNGENDILRYQSVSAILSAIGIGGMGTQEEIGSTWIDKNGNYKTGIVEGTITGEYTACYIGVRAREKFRMEKIAQLEKQVMELQAGLAECKAKVQEYAENIRSLEEEWNTFPAGTDMQTVARELWEKNNESEQIHKELERLRTQLQSVKTELDQIELRVREICSKCYLTARLDVFVNTLQALGRYQGLLTEIQVKHGKYRSGISNLHSLADTLSALDEDLDTIRYELGRVNSKVRALETELKSIEEQLALTDYEKIKERLDYCLERLPKIPKEREHSMGLQTKWQEEAKRLGADILQQEEQQQKNRKRYQWLEKGFREEYRLGYVERFFVVNEDMEDQADKVCAMLSERLGTKKKAELHERLQGAFHENKGYLLHYQLTMQTMFADEEEEELNPAVSMRRTDIVAKYRGMNVKFKELVGKLREDAEEQKHLLSDKERELFEDILANTISKKIRAKIHASNRWVEKMNQLMGSMQTSSGLKLSLRWKHKRAEKEGQLDTRELVELLSKDSEIMRVEELDKLSVHFRTKIEEARKLSEDGNSVQSFHAIMREVLDYRKWFEFTLECEKTGEKKREMTDRVFFTFSGGEKAMSMYVPLFSAVVAKYAGARPDAPRLISLDEAFAGVDETNIRDMFRLMVECQFNFMINSQVLWGDYDTVPGLAIYQLLRPENAKYVTVIKYIWNGKEKLVVA